MKYITIIATILTLGTANAFAHSGHGVTDANQLLHYVAEVAHIAPAALLGAIVFLIVRKRRSAAK